MDEDDYAFNPDSGDDKDVNDVETQVTESEEEVVIEQENYAIQRKRKKPEEQLDPYDYVRYHAMLSEEKHRKKRRKHRHKHKHRKHHREEHESEVDIVEEEEEEEKERPYKQILTKQIPTKRIENFFKVLDKVEADDNKSKNEEALEKRKLSPSAPVQKVAPPIRKKMKMTKGNINILSMFVSTDDPKSSVTAQPTVPRPCSYKHCTDLIISMRAHVDITKTVSVLDKSSPTGTTKKVLYFCSLNCSMKFNEHLKQVAAQRAAIIAGPRGPPY